MKILSKSFSKKEIGSVKFGIKLDDGNVIEAVIFPKDNYTVCLSSQVGCAIKCVFCESGKDGFIRNLSAEEMICQFKLVNNYVIKKINKKGIGYIVIMGIGEPLLNYKNVTEFIKKIKRIKMALCTVGITNNIYKLIEEKIPVKLCVSLHATNNAQRKKIIPTANKYNFDDLITAIHAFEKKGNSDSPIDIHYLIFNQLNDRQTDAKKIVELFGDGNFRIIIKSVCPVKDQKYFETSPKNKAKFIKILKMNKINHYSSLSRGIEIKAGCGQLRRYLIGAK
jgi:23S rRNA (adenine2503-C2)-methyltransferase